MDNNIINNKKTQKLENNFLQSDINNYVAPFLKEIVVDKNDENFDINRFLNQDLEK